MSNSSLLCTGFPPASPSSSNAASSSSRGQTDDRRSSTLSCASTYSRDSWCSFPDSEVSVSSTTQGHTSHNGDAFEGAVLPSIATNAIFGSTSPRKNRSHGVRTSIESTRSWGSSGSSVRSPITPDSALFSHREHEVTKTPTFVSVFLPTVAEAPKLKRPLLSRIVSDEIQYIGRSIDVPVSEEGHRERTAPIKRSISSTSTLRDSSHSSRFSTWNGKDGLMMAMDELEQELARTMATLSISTSNTPVSTISRARGKAMRRPHTADKVMAVDSAKNFSQTAVSSSVSPASRSHFERESWMSSQSDENGLSYNGNPIRFSASDLALLAESAELSGRSSVQNAQIGHSDRPVSQVSTASSSSSRASRIGLDGSSLPALVFDGRYSGSSTSSSGEDSFQEVLSHPDDIAIAAPGHVAAHRKAPRSRPGTARESSEFGRRPGLYQLQKASRSTPSLASNQPPHEPLPPLPSLPMGLSKLLSAAPAPPPRPIRSLGRTPTSSDRSSPVPYADKPLPRLPC